MGEEEGWSEGRRGMEWGKKGGVREEEGWNGGRRGMDKVRRGMEWGKKRGGVGAEGRSRWNKIW